MTSAAPAPASSNDSVLPTPEPSGAPARRRTSAGVRLALLLLFVICAGLAFAVLALWQRLQIMTGDSARRLQQIETTATEAHALAKQAGDELRALQARVIVAESKIDDYAAQRAALDRLLNDSVSREQSRTVAEFDQVLTLADEEARLAGSPTILLNALKALDARSDSAPPGLRERLKAAIGKDMDALRKLDWPDREQLMGRFDDLQRLLDEVPLGVDKRAETPRPAKAPNPSAKASAVAATPTRNWRDWLAAFFQPVAGWFEIRRIDSPDALLSTPEQTVWVRENLKMQLQSARLALLSRQAETYDRSIAQARAALLRYADAKQPKVQQALALLQQLAAVKVGAQLPRPRETRAVLASVAGVR